MTFCSLINIKHEKPIYTLAKLLQGPIHIKFKLKRTK